MKYDMGESGSPNQIQGRSQISKREAAEESPNLGHEKLENKG